MNPLALLGLAGGLCFAFAAVPTAVRTVRAGRHLGTPLSLILAVVGWVVLTYAYLLAAHGFDWVLAVTYGIEGTSWAVLLVYLVKSKAQGEQRHTQQCGWLLGGDFGAGFCQIQSAPGDTLCAFHRAAFDRQDFEAGPALEVVS